MQDQKKDQQKRKVLKKKKAETSSGDDEPPFPDKDSEDSSDAIDDGIGDIESFLRKLKLKRSACSGAESRILEEEIKRVSNLIDELADMDADEALDVIQQEKRRIQIMERLNAMGKCPMGYVWIWTPSRNEFVCGGGSHSASAKDLGLTDRDKRILEKKV